LAGESKGEKKWNIINDVSDYAPGVKYSCFIGGDNPFSWINNPDITDGSSCVVIKESYGNAFVPFLVDHYQMVYVVDYRYYEDNLIDFVKENCDKKFSPLNRIYNITWLNGCLITYDISKRLAKKLIKLGIESTGIVDNKDKIPQSCLNVQQNNQRIGAKLFANKLSELFCPECDYGGANIRETITALLKKMYGGDNNGK